MYQLPSDSLVNFNIMILPQKLRWLYKASQPTPTTLTGRCQHSADGSLNSSSKQHTFLRALWLAHFAPGSVCTCNFGGCQRRPLAGGLGEEFRFSLGRVFVSARAPDDSSLRPFTAVRACLIEAFAFTWIVQKVSSSFFPGLTFTKTLLFRIPSCAFFALFRIVSNSSMHWSTLPYFGLRSCSF